jgi:hypothetical protein
MDAVAAGDTVFLPDPHHRHSLVTIDGPNWAGGDAGSIATIDAHDRHVEPIIVDLHDANPRQGGGIEALLGKETSQLAGVTGCTFGYVDGEIGDSGPHTILL